MNTDSQYAQAIRNLYAAIQKGNDEVIARQQAIVHEQQGRLQKAGWTQTAIDDYFDHLFADCYPKYPGRRGRVRR